MEKTIEIPEGYEARIEGNKVILERKEREDERIRKELIEFLDELWHLGKNTNFDRWGKADCAKWIAYLEKQKGIVMHTPRYAPPEQKEQKPVQDKNEREYVRTLKSLIADFLRDKDEIDRGYYQKIYDWLDGRHIEQKSADDKDAIEPTPKQDYSGLTDFERAFHRGFLCAGVENVPIGIIKDTAQDCLAHIKLAEWSEEDEKMFNSLCTVLHGGFSSIPLESFIYWLKSLRPHPHWKPSQEQIDALNSIILNGSFTYVGQVQDLISLKDDLKKL